MSKEYNTRSYSNVLKEKRSGEYELIGEYVKNPGKIKAKHVTCGHVWEANPSALLNKSLSCPVCSRRSRMRSPEEYKKEVSELTNDEYEVLGDYINKNTHVLMRHNKCGNEWMIRPDFFINRGTRCPKCANKGKLLAHDVFVKQIQEFYGDSLEVVGKYKRSYDPIEIKIKKCGHIIERTPFSLKANKTKNKDSKIYCNVCPKVDKTEEYKENNTNKKLEKLALEVEQNEGFVLKEDYSIQHKLCGNTFKYPLSKIKLAENNKLEIECPSCRKHDEFKLYVSECGNGEFELLDRYVHSTKKLRFKHTKGCGGIFYRSPAIYKQTQSCGICGNKKGVRKTNEEFQKELDKRIPGQYKIEGEYISRDCPVMVKHLKCGNIYSVTPDTLYCKEDSYNRMKTTYCPNCTEPSSGERYIEDYLKNKKVEYDAQKTFKDCKYIYVLRFDFALYKNGELIALLEFDGAQHIEPVEMFGGEEGLKRRQRNDNIKNKYAKKIGVRMIRIPQSQEDRLEEILDRWIERLYGQKNISPAA